MKKFVSRSLDSCLLEASRHFDCTIAQLDYEVIQDSSPGFFGLGKKEAIIIASHRGVASLHDQKEDSLIEPVIAASPESTMQESSLDHQEEFYQVCLTQYDRSDQSQGIKSDLDKPSLDTATLKTPPSKNSYRDMQSACRVIQKELTELLALLPIEIDTVEVSPYDGHYVFILLDGPDAALLIGQKGYRYKSLSYLLFNWINNCYGYGVRLEIAQFLKNQEELIRIYLAPIIQTAKEEGSAQTKNLDGVLAHLALRLLREALPNKYIVSRDAACGEKYITIGDFVNQAGIQTSKGFGAVPKY